VLVGFVVERTDGAGFDAVTAAGEYLGTFATRSAASRALPSAGAS
jgi:hypothetical protein